MRKHSVPSLAPITPGAWFSDNAGSLVMITEVSEHRVTYVRYGYSAPCVCSIGRLQREFNPVTSPASMGKTS